MTDAYSVNQPKRESTQTVVQHFKMRRMQTTQTKCLKQRQHRLENHHQICFITSFPGSLCPRVLFVHLERTFEKSRTVFLGARYHSCHPTNSVKALKQT